MIKVESLVFDYPGKRASFALLVVHAMLPAIFHAAELDVLHAPLSLYPEGGLGPAGLLLVESALAVCSCAANGSATHVRSMYRAKQRERRYARACA